MILVFDANHYFDEFSFKEWMWPKCWFSPNLNLGHFGRPLVELYSMLVHLKPKMRCSYEGSRFKSQYFLKDYCHEISCKNV